MRKWGFRAKFKNWNSIKPLHFEVPAHAQILSCGSE
jgi:hypothetical protein